jgi:hypothetical protein
MNYQYFPDFSHRNIFEFARNKSRIVQRIEIKVMKEGCGNKK